MNRVSLCIVKHDGFWFFPPLCLAPWWAEQLSRTFAAEFGPLAGSAAASWCQTGVWRQDLKADTQTGGASEGAPDLHPAPSSAHLLKVELRGAQREHAGLHLLEEQPALAQLLPEGVEVVHVTQRVVATTTGEPARSCWREDKKIWVKPEEAAG